MFCVLLWFVRGLVGGVLAVLVGLSFMGFYGFVLVFGVVLF